MKFLICFLLNTLLIKLSFAMGGAVVNPDQNVGANFIFQEEYSGLSESYLSPQTTVTREYSAEDNSRSYSLNEYISLNNQAIQTWNHLLECNSGSIKIARENYFNSTLCQNPEDRPSALSKLLELKGSTQSYLISAPSSRYGNPLNIKKFPMHPLLSQIFVEYLVSIRHKFQEGQKAVYGKIAPTNSLELEVNMMMCLDLNIQNKTCDYLKDIINPKYARTVIEHSLLSYALLILACAWVSGHMLLFSLLSSTILFLALRLAIILL